MKWTVKKVAYGFIGVLVIIASAPFASISKQPMISTSTVTSIPITVESTLGPTPTQMTAVPTATLLPTIQAASSPLSTELYAFIQAPEGPLAQPYVILEAFQAVPDVSIEIRGILNSREFTCKGSPCALPVLSSSTVVFQAISEAGAMSEEVSATIRVELAPDGYYVYLDTVSQFAAFSDSCLRFWRIQDYSNPVWAEFVQFPYMLNTDKTLHHLAARLITHGVVDVTGCSDGGLSANLDWPTACGLERASSAMIEWQNQFDEFIWLASGEIGIPPRILKTLIEVESQFWPGNERFRLDEIGLGQINQLGVDVLLRRDPLLYRQICSTVLDDCSDPYHQLSDEDQAMIRGAYLNSQNADCPTCEYGLDLTVAKRSVRFIAQVLRANCEVVKKIADENRPADPDYIDKLDDPYSDFWKFTLFTYHSGSGCFEQAVEATPDSVPLSWENLSQYIVECESGESYVDGLWGNLLRFDTYRYSRVDQNIVEQVAPIFAPTPTPYATPAPSTAQVMVQVFLDRNQNGIAEESELMNGVSVLLQGENQVELGGRTVNGRVTFELAEFPVGSDVRVSLPGLYRGETITVPEQGILPVVFIFNQPTLPTVIP
jgi:hypothetical protein